MASASDFILTGKHYCLDCVMNDTKTEMEPLDNVASETKRACPTCSGTEFLVVREQERKPAE